MWPFLSSGLGPSLKQMGIISRAQGSGLGKKKDHWHGWGRELSLRSYASSKRYIQVEVWGYEGVARGAV